MDDGDALVIVGRLEYTGSIGYGDVFALRVDSAEPRLEQESVRLTVLAGDRTADFVTAHQAPTVVEATFARGEPDQPYATSPTTGFVDPGGTEWRLTGIREVPG